MTRMMTIAAAIVSTILVLPALSVAAQQPDTRDRTIMTFSSAIELPGMRLEPGTYVFRIADTAARNVIQVLAADETQMLGQWLFVPAERQEVTGDTVVTFRETSAASTPAVQYWYYPGEKIGKEFIYPKDQAMRIAARTGATVLTEGGPVKAEATTASASAQPEPRPGPAQADAAAGPALTQGTQAQSTVAAAQPPATPDTRGFRQESTVEPTGTIARNELPSTASPYPLVGLIALVSLVGAVGIRAFRR